MRRRGYHLVQFVPDPFTKTALTIGALVQVDGGWRFAVAPCGELIIPAAFPRAVTTLYRALVADLLTLTAPRLPLSLGPLVQLLERVEIPGGVLDPPAWVIATALR